MSRDFLIGVGSSMASSSVVLIMFHQPAMIVPLCIGIGIGIVIACIKSKG